ncbi:hypothetical protein D3C76_1101020 [compost metagenome]
MYSPTVSDTRSGVTCCPAKSANAERCTWPIRVLVRSLRCWLSAFPALLVAASNWPTASCIGLIISSWPSAVPAMPLMMSYTLPKSSPDSALATCCISF